MERLKIVSLVLIFVVSLFWFSCGNQPKGSVLDIEVKGLDGRTHNLMEVNGDLILVNFWATWCRPCREEIPELIQLQNEYRDKGLSIVGISMDIGDTGKVKEFAQIWKINYPIFIGNQKAVQRYGGFPGIPVSFLVDKDGNIQKAYMGSVNKEMVEKDLKNLLKR